VTRGLRGELLTAVWTTSWSVSARKCDPWAAPLPCAGPHAHLEALQQGVVQGLEVALEARLGVHCVPCQQQGGGQEVTHLVGVECKEAGGWPSLSAPRGAAH